MAGKMLIVDAEASYNRMLTAVARAVKIEPLVASSLKEARELARTHHPNLAVVDASQCDGPGAGLISYLRNLDEEVAIITTSANTRIETVLEAIREGTTDFIVKPYSAQQFAVTLAGLLKRVSDRRIALEDTSITVLVVEDDPLTLKFTSSMLKSVGINAIMAMTLTEARQLLDEHPPDVALVDVFLGEESGLDLLKELRVERPQLPVIVVTASEKPEIAIQALRSGAYAMFVKPLKQEPLYRTILSAHRYHAAEEHRRWLEAEIQRVKGEACRAQEALEQLKREHQEQLRRLQEEQQVARQKQGAPPPALPPMVTLPGQVLAEGAIQSLACGVLLLDEKSCVVEVNRAVEVLLGVPREQLVKQPLNKISILTPFVAHVRRTLDSGQNLNNLEVELSLQRGQRFMWTNIGRIYVSSEPRGVVVAFQDITSRKRLEGQRHQTDHLASLGLIAAGLIEEVANPTYLAASYADLILKEPADATKCRQYGMRVKTSLQRVSQLATQVARLIYAPRTEIGPCDLHEVIREVCELLSGRFLLGSQQVVLSLDASMATVMGEPLDFQHLFLTLILNVSDWLQPGRTIQISSVNHTGVVEIRVGSVATEGEAVNGIPTPELISLSKTAALGREHLGLDHCRNIVNRFGGAIRQETSQGPRVTFTVRLPPALPEECSKWVVRAGSMTAAAIAACGTEGNTKAALLIPTEATAGLCRSWLEESGVSVITYPDLGTALQAHAQDKPDVFVLDTVNNSGDWLEFLRYVSENSLSPSVVLLDEISANQHQEELKELGRCRLLHRPLRPEKLLQAVAMVELEDATA